MTDYRGVPPRVSCTIEQLLQNKLWISNKSEIEDFGLELETKIRDSSRVQKTVKFGKIPSFRILGVATDVNNHGIGVGLGRSRNKVDARVKSFNAAKKALSFIKLGCGSLACLKDCAICHSLTKRATGKCGSTTALLMPAELGSGVTASPRIAEIIKQIGIKDLRVKLRGSPNPMNCVKAVYKALVSYTKK
jgi:ribosomal protein S5